MQLVAMMCIERGIMSHKMHKSPASGGKYVSHFPYPTELNIADTHAYYICNCKHAHLDFFIILNASSTDYMLF